MKKEKINQEMTVIEENALKIIKKKEEKFLYFQDIFSVVVLFFSMFFVLSISIDYFKKSKLYNFSMALFLILIAPFSCFLFIKLSYIIGNFVENKILFKNDKEYQLAIRIMSEYYKKRNESFKKKILKKRMMNFANFLNEIFLVDIYEKENQTDKNKLNNLKSKNVDKIIRNKIEKKAFKIVKEKTGINWKKISNNSFVIFGNMIMIICFATLLEINFHFLKTIFSDRQYNFTAFFLPILFLFIFVLLTYLEYKIYNYLYFRKNKKYLLSLRIVKKFLKKRNDYLKELKKKEKIENYFNVLINKEDEIKQEKIRIKEFEKYLKLIEEWLYYGTIRKRNF